MSNIVFFRDAQKEFGEGSITLVLATGKQLPYSNELGVDSTAYLNGLGEAVGEIRHYFFDNMRKGDLSRGEELLAVMDDIYSVLVTMPRRHYQRATPHYGYGERHSGKDAERPRPDYSAVKLGIETREAGEKFPVAFYRAGQYSFLPLLTIPEQIISS